MTQQQPPMQVESHVNALTNVTIAADEEQFVLTLFSGNHVRRYLATPKHAKRIMLRLQQFVEQHEQTFGELETDLPKGEEQKTATKSEMGFGDR